MVWWFLEWVFCDTLSFRVVISLEVLWMWRDFLIFQSFNQIPCQETLPSQVVLAAFSTPTLMVMVTSCPRSLIFCLKTEWDTIRSPGASDFTAGWTLPNSCVWDSLDVVWWKEIQNQVTVAWRSIRMLIVMIMRWLDGISMQPGVFLWLDVLRRTPLQMCFMPFSCRLKPVCRCVEYVGRHFWSKNHNAMFQVKATYPPVSSNMAIAGNSTSHSSIFPARNLYLYPFMIIYEFPKPRLRTPEGQSNLHHFTSIIVPCHCWFNHVKCEPWCWNMLIPTSTLAQNYHPVF